MSWGSVSITCEVGKGEAENAPLWVAGITAVPEPINAVEVVLSATLKVSSRLLRITWISSLCFSSLSLLYPTRGASVPLARVRSMSRISLGFLKMVRRQGHG